MQPIYAARQFVWVVVFLAMTALPAQAGEWMFWFTSPISGSPEHQISLGVSWHGRLMVLAWAFLMPLAFVVARYFKIVPGQKWPERLDNPFWFITHRRIGYALVAVMTFALLLVVAANGFQTFPGDSYHGWLGWLIATLGWLQILGGLMRGTHGGPVNPFTREPKPLDQWPGDHFSMTRRRIFFEWSHKAIGYLLILLIVVVIFTGLLKADAPRWMWAAICVWWVFCVCTVVFLQRNVRCIDTYQSIWGFDQSLSGYSHKPIGIGITRFKIDETSHAPWQSNKQSKNDPKPTGNHHKKSN